MLYRFLMTVIVVSILVFAGSAKALQTLQPNLLKQLDQCDTAFLIDPAVGIPSVVAIKGDPIPLLTQEVLESLSRGNCRTARIVFMGGRGGGPKCVPNGLEAKAVEVLSLYTGLLSNADLAQAEVSQPYLDALEVATASGIEWLSGDALDELGRFSNAQANGIAAGFFADGSQPTHLRANALSHLIYHSGIDGLGLDAVLASGEAPEIKIRALVGAKAKEISLAPAQLSAMMDSAPAEVKPYVGDYAMKYNRAAFCAIQRNRIDHPEATQRRFAALCMTEAEDETALQRIIWNDPDLQVRRAAIHACGEMSGKSGLGVLEKLSKEMDGELAEETVKSLSKRKQKETEDQLVWMAYNRLGELSDTVIADLILSLDAVPGKASKDAVAHIEGNHPNPYIKRIAQASANEDLSDLAWWLGN